eukprot:gene8856-805_t
MENKNVHLDEKKSDFKDNPFFKKNMTIGKKMILKSLGKVDPTDHPEGIENPILFNSYKKGYPTINHGFQDLHDHYKEMLQNNKKLVKTQGQVMADETTFAEGLIHYSQKIKAIDKDITKVTNPYLKCEMEFPETLKVCGSTMMYFSELFTMFQHKHQDFYDKVFELNQDTETLLNLKSEYKVAKLEHDTILTKLNTIKKQHKTNDLRLPTLTREYEEAKDYMNDIFLDLCDEYEFTRRRRDIDYSSHLKDLLNEYHDFFKTGLKVLESVQEKVETKNLPKFERKKYLEKEQKMNKKIYGIDIDVIAEREDRRTPEIFEYLINYLKNNALNVEGIFRISGEQPEIDKIKRIINEGTIPSDQELNKDIHVTSGCLKLYLRSLPIPLLTYNAYDIFLSIADVEDENLKLEKLSTIILSLSPIKIYSLGILLDLLFEIQLNSDKNKMNIKNLAIVFGNNILKSPYSDQSKLMKDQTKITSLTESLILLYPKLKQVLFEGRAIVSSLPPPIQTEKPKKMIIQVPSSPSSNTSSIQETQKISSSVKRVKPLPTLPPKGVSVTPQKIPTKPKSPKLTPRDIDTPVQEDDDTNENNEELWTIYVDDTEVDMTIPQIQKRLPPGWVVYPTDEEDDVYYYEEETQESHWEVPDDFDRSGLFS